MENGRFFNKRFRNRRGAAGVALVLLIAVVFIVVIVKTFLKEAPVNPDTVKNLSPWNEWKCRQSPSYIPGRPLEEQPKITDAMSFDTNVWVGEGFTSRGLVRFYIMSDGSISGEWYGDYHHTVKVQHDIMNGSFEGGAYHGMIYEDENGEDRSKLYLMAKGNFLIQVADNEKGTISHIGGELYVRGWLDTESVFTGRITITPDRMYSETFRFRVKDDSKSPDRKDGFFMGL
jgi:hypothetical protein